VAEKGMREACSSGLTVKRRCNGSTDEWENEANRKERQEPMNTHTHKKKKKDWNKKARIEIKIS
jgi:hypothetical protein